MIINIFIVIKATFMGKVKSIIHVVPCRLLFHLLPEKFFSPHFTFAFSVCVFLDAFLLLPLSFLPGKTLSL